MFRQADRCFIILLDDEGRLVPQVVKIRRPDGRTTSGSAGRSSASASSRGQAYLSADASNDANLGPAPSIAEFRIRSVMCAPLVTADGKPLGAIQLDTQDRGRKFREDDLKLLTIVANLASVAIEKAQMHASVLAREKEQNEIEIARKVQLGFLPQDVPGVSGLRVLRVLQPGPVGRRRLLRLHPAAATGGWRWCSGDVAGKGVPAALLMAKLSAEVRFCLLTKPDPAKAVMLLNDQLIRGGHRRPVRHPGGGRVIDPADQPAARWSTPGTSTRCVYRRRDDLARGHHERRERAAARDRAGVPVRGRSGCRWSRGTPCCCSPTG